MTPTEARRVTAAIALSAARSDALRLAAAHPLVTAEWVEVVGWCTGALAALEAVPREVEVPEAFALDGHYASTQLATARDRCPEVRAIEEAQRACAEARERTQRLAVRAPATGRAA